MNDIQLESPVGPDELYLARGEELVAERPLATGDVFADVLVGTSSEMVIVITHPCSMRRDGVNLVDRVCVAPVREKSGLRWRGHYRFMPLPDLMEFGDQYGVYLDDFERVQSELLDANARVASLDRRGVNLLMQRFVHHLTRVVVPTADIDAMCAAAFEELDLMEEWRVAGAEEGVGMEEVTLACHEWLRSGNEGQRPQDLLWDPQSRAAVRRESTAAITHFLRSVES